MAEIRLDLCKLNLQEIDKLFKSHGNLIATFRKSGKIRDCKRVINLKKAIESGAAFIDLDYLDDRSIMPELKELALQHGTRIIVSFHDHEKTPEKEAIYDLIGKISELKPDLIKLVFYSKSPEDNQRVLDLYKSFNNLVAFNMGQIGKMTRIASIRLGAPFTYVRGENFPTAEGQMTLKEMKMYSRKAII